MFENIEENFNSEWNKADTTAYPLVTGVIDREGRLV